MTGVGPWFRAAATAVVMVLALAGPVAAETVVDRDTFSLGLYAQGNACYGKCGVPNHAILEWRLWDGTPMLRGATAYAALGVVGPNPAQICTRIKAILRAKDGTRLAQRAGTGVNIVCLPKDTAGNGRGGTPIDLYRPVYKPNLSSVRVILQVSGQPMGPRRNRDAVTCAWRTTDCNAV